MVVEFTKADLRATQRQALLSTFWTVVAGVAFFSLMAIGNNQDEKRHFKQHENDPVNLKSLGGNVYHLTDHRGQSGDLLHHTDYNFINAVTAADTLTAARRGEAIGRFGEDGLTISVPETSDNRALIFRTVNQARHYTLK